jgi:propanol-preferring alcohol dehydrogenase
LDEPGGLQLRDDLGHARRRDPLDVGERTERERAFALDLGAAWAGASEETPPEKLHAIIDTTPAWKPVVDALKHLIPGGRLVINAIRKEERDKTELLRLDFPAHLWLEKEIKSVANANQALTELKEGMIRGAKVLRTA